MRANDRLVDALREIKITRNFQAHAEGSVLVEFGQTKVICSASVNFNQVPRFLKGSQKGWVTAEYGMLPRSTNERMDREAARGKQTGRTMEIQRLIARSLRAMVDLKVIKDHSIVVDCDVIQADGGTRTAAITGAAVALCDALSHMHAKVGLSGNPVIAQVAAVSVGIIDGVPMLDLDYHEDSAADTDMNVVMTDAGKFIEIQGTAENNAFSEHELTDLLGLAKQGISQLHQKQREALELAVDS